MTLPLIILFLATPILEAYVLITAGGFFGAIPVILACITTAVAGGVILRIQGLSALQSLQTDVSAGKPPVHAAVDGVFLLVAAPLLMTPGFVTDAIGFAFLTPPIRRWLARVALRRLQSKIEQGEAVVTVRQFSADRWSATEQRGDPDDLNQ